MNQVKAAASFVDAAKLLWGSHWQGDAAEALEINPRTVQRIAKAAAEGAPERIAPGLFVELHQRLIKHATDCLAMGNAVLMVRDGEG